jgi:DNA-binding transcriptional LysR family regulator
MEWQHIVGFYHVARLGSFTKAAEATFRTQSALSQQVKTLEEELGCLLVERIGKKRLLLTPAGETFFRFAQEVLEKREALAQSLQDLEGVQRGTLTIAAPFTTLYHALPEYVMAYLKRFAEVQLTILDRPQRTVIDLLKSGDADFGFVLQSSLGKDLVGFPWKTVEPVLMIPIGHPLGTEKAVTFEKIAQYPLILPPRAAVPCGLFNVEQRFRQLGLPFSLIMESSNVELSSLYVEMGLGVSFATVIKDLPVLRRRRLRFLSLDHYFQSDHLTVALKRGRTMLPYKSAFLSLLLKDSADGLSGKQGPDTEPIAE